jgi:hypothetical protein
MRSARCLNGHKREAPKIRASSCSSFLRGESSLIWLARCNARPQTVGRKRRTSQIDSAFQDLQRVDAIRDAKLLRA